MIRICHIDYGHHQFSTLKADHSHPRLCLSHHHLLVLHGKKYVRKLNRPESESSPHEYERCSQSQG